MRKTKIICTLGPAVDNEDTLRKLMQKGMDIARLNFSHGTHEEHKIRVDRFKKIREELNLPVALLLDTKGPEIRLGKFDKGEIVLKEGERFTLVNDDILGDETKCSISYKELYKDVKKGNKILINDGLVELEVINIKDKDIVCEVLNGGTIGNHKGVNVPGVKVNLPSLTQKDIEDIKFAVENDFDFIAASFVRKPSDVKDIKNVLEEFNGEDINVIAKIENREAIENVDEIIKVSDGIMVARGDLLLNINPITLPMCQKQIIDMCKNRGKVSVVATEVLDSLADKGIINRAELSDIALAVRQGASAIMLARESGNSQHAKECIQLLNKIIEIESKNITFSQLVELI